MPLDIGCITPPDNLLFKKSFHEDVTLSRGSPSRTLRTWLLPGTSKYDDVSRREASHDNVAVVLAESLVKYQ
jgi:hypothetical protein